MAVSLLSMNKAIPRGWWIPIVFVFVSLQGNLAEAKARNKELREARELFKKAETYFSLREFEVAMEFYKAAFKKKPLPGFLFNIGQCSRMLGRCKEAEFYYRLFLQKTRRAGEKEKLFKLLGQCRALKGPESPGPDDAAKQPDHKAGASPPSAAGKGKTPPDHKAGASKPVAGREPKPVDLSPGEGRGRDIRREPPVPRAYFWAGVGITAALAVASVATGVMARNENQQFNDPETPVDQQLEHRETGQALEVAMWTTLGLGIAAAASTTVLHFFTTPRGDAAAAPHGTTRIGFSPLRAGGAISLEGRF